MMTPVDKLLFAPPVTVTADSDGFLSVPVTVNESPAEIKVPEDVITRALSGAYDPGECIDGYTLIELVTNEHPSEGVFVDHVTISTPEGVKIKVSERFYRLENGKVTWYTPVEQVVPVN